MPKKSLVIFGKDTGVEVLSAARQADKDLFESIDLIPFEENLSENAVVQTLKQSNNTLFYNIAIADQKLKQEAQKFAESESMIAFTVVHPTAVIDPTATVGEGTFVGPLCVISSNAEIGKHSIIHIHSSIGHHAKLGDFCAILPGARISGHVVLGQSVLVGSNAFVFQSVTLGDFAKVDALTYVKENLPPRQIASCRSPRGPH